MLTADDIDEPRVVESSKKLQSTRKCSINPGGSLTHTILPPRPDPVHVLARYSGARQADLTAILAPFVGITFYGFAGNANVGATNCITVRSVPEVPPMPCSFVRRI